MTTLQMIAAFDTLKDLYQAPYYDIEDKLLFLNNAIISFVDSHFSYEEDGKKMFQSTQRATDSIYTLIDTKEILGDTTDIKKVHSAATNGFTIPLDYRHFLTCEIKWINDSRALRVNTVTYDEINQLLLDPFSRPNDTDNVYICWHKKKIIVYSKTAPAKLFLTYCKNPLTIDEATNCDLPELSHRAVVKKAVLEAIAIAEEDTRAKLTPLINN